MLSQKEVMELPNLFSIVINTDIDNHFKAYRVLDNLHTDGILVSFHRTAGNLKNMLLRHGYDADKLHFIDLVSKAIDAKKLTEKSDYLLTPKLLNEVGALIENIARNNVKNKFVIFDSLHLLHLFHDEKTIINFVDFVHKRAKLLGMKTVFIANKERLSKGVKQKLNSIADRVIQP